MKKQKKLTMEQLQFRVESIYDDVCEFDCELFELKQKLNKECSERKSYQIALMICLACVGLSIIGLILFA